MRSFSSPTANNQGQLVTAQFYPDWDCWPPAALVACGETKWDSWNPGNPPTLQIS